MEIKVKSAKVLKTGENEKGAWSLIKVVDETTGIEYTTFDKKAHIGAGAVLDIGEPEIKEGKRSFKKCEIISEDAPRPQNESMTKEDWSAKDKIQRMSIERQVCLKCATEVFVSRGESVRGESVTTLLGVAEEMYQWVSQKASPEATKSKSELVKEGFIELDWLKESLTELQRRGKETYSNKNTLSFLNKLTGVEAKSITEAVSNLNKEKANRYELEILKALELEELPF
jgi:hypothetical protein|tara:strand:- start:3760 stop:4446 length:687 start_codon:yes stop_codon:yes gene_type:complete